MAIAPTKTAVDAAASPPASTPHAEVTVPRGPIPALEPRPDGLAERFSARVGAESPVRVFFVAVLLGYAALAIFMIGTGLLLTKVLLPIGGFSAWDEGINRWLADHRNSTLEHLSWLGSTLAGGLVIPLVIVFFVVVFAARRHWRLAAFTLFVICVESGAYRVTTLAVHRDRPRVPRLESLPIDASFPSGHTAAALALYGGLLLMLASRVRRTSVTICCLALATATPLFVAWARMYRGMHHLTDAAAGVLLGIGALLIAIFAARASSASAARRAEREVPDEAGSRQ